MQERLTSNKIYDGYIYSNGRKRGLGIAVVVLILPLVFVIFFANFLSKTNQYCYEKNCYYLLSLYSDRREELAIANQSKVTGVGGAGYVLLKDNIYHIIAFCFEDLMQAQELKKKYMQEFSKVSIITIESKGISFNKKKIIERNKVLKDGFTVICETPSIVLGIYNDFTKEQDITECYNSICEIEARILYCIEEVTRLEKIEDIEEICQTICTFLTKNLEAIAECKDDIYINNAIQKNLNLLHVEACLLMIDLKDSLKTL